MSKKTLSQSDIDAVAGLPSREAASILGVGKSTVNKYREIARQNGGKLPVGSGTQNHKVIHEGATSNLETRANGDLSVETINDMPQTKADIDEAMIKRGFDPEQYEFSYRFSEWQAQRGGGEIITMYAARASATPKRGNANKEALDVTELLEAVRDWKFEPVITNGFASADAVLAFADPQLGKTDLNGGTPETIEQIMGSFHAFVERIKEEKPTEVIFADLGDGLENFNNTSSQRETNDMDLTSQVRALRRIQAEGLRMIRPYCKTLAHVSVPSNHGSVRIGPQQQASTASNDWGLEVSHQLEDVFEQTDLGVVFLRTAGLHDISTSWVTENFTSLGFTHGDQASQNQMPEWWMKQAFDWESRLRNVDLLLYGHHHNQTIVEVSEGRWAISCASSDRGSAWFTNRTGRSATSGMTTFMTAHSKFWDLELI